LHVAADFLQLEVFKLLWNHSKVDKNVIDNLGRNVLMTAVDNVFNFKSKQLIEIIRLITAISGFNFDAKNIDGKSALMIARDKCHGEEIIEALKTKVKIDYDQTLSSTSLLKAQAGDVEGIRLLLASKEFNANYKDARGRTALHVAADYLQVQVFELLWNNSKVNKKVLDNEGRTVLHIVVMNSPTYKIAQSMEVLTLIMGGAYFDFDAKDTNGKTALLIAREKVHSDAVINLIKTKAKIDPEIILTTSTPIYTHQNPLAARRVLEHVPSSSDDDDCCCIIM